MGEQVIKGAVQCEIHKDRVVVQFPMQTRTTSNARGHWRVLHKIAQAQRSATRLCTTMALRQFRDVRPLSVLLTRIAPRRVDEGTEMDALKHVRDGVADALGCADTGRDGIAWLAAQDRAGVREHAVRVEVWHDDSKR